MILRMWKKEEGEDARALAEQKVEVWAPCHLAPDRYFVSNLGRMVSAVYGTTLMLMKQSLIGSDRPSVGIYINRGDRKSKTWLVYRLMLWAFDGPPPLRDESQALHSENGVTDNRLCSVRWGSRSENMKDVVKHKLLRKEEKEIALEEKSRTTLTGERKRRGTIWYAGALNDKEKVQKGIELYEKKKASIEDIAVLWGCGPDAARNAILGNTHPDLKREGRTTTSGRCGENHHAAVCTDAALIEALDLYVKNKWSGVQFAKHLGIKQITADAILKGRNRKGVPRPDGFMYPWPDAKTMNVLRGADHGGAKMSNEEIQELFAKIENGELTSISAIQEETNLSRSVIYGIISGRSWSTTPRSEKLQEQIAKFYKKKATLEL